MARDHALLLGCWCANGIFQHKLILYNEMMSWGFVILIIIHFYLCYWCVNDGNRHVSLGDRFCIRQLVTDLTVWLHFGANQHSVNNFVLYNPIIMQPKFFWLGWVLGWEWKVFNKMNNSPTYSYPQRNTQLEIYFQLLYLATQMILTYDIIIIA